MDADGTDLRQVVAEDATFRGFMGPTWSPDGRRIAFSAQLRSAPPPGFDIWVVNADGSNLRQLTRTPHRTEVELDWRPGGSQIAFSAVTTMWRPIHLYLIDLNGGNVRALTRGDATNFASPKWSPDGRRIAFVRWPNILSPDVPGNWGRAVEIWFMNANGRSQMRLTHNDVPDSEPTWSPDGRRIAFVRSTRQADPLCFVPNRWCSPSDIYVMNADRTGLKQLTHTSAGERNPAWQPSPAS